MPPRTVMTFLICVLISFILEKLLSTEAVLTGMERQIFARMLIFGKIYCSISLVVSSTNCKYRFLGVA